MPQSRINEFSRAPGSQKCAISRQHCLDVVAGCQADEIRDMR
jgi:hypothetical protein